MAGSAAAERRESAGVRVTHALPAVMIADSAVARRTVGVTHEQPGSTAIITVAKERSTSTQVLKR